MQSASPATAGIGHETSRDAASVANTFGAGIKFFWDWTGNLRTEAASVLDWLGFDAEAPCGRYRGVCHHPRATGDGRR